MTTNGGAYPASLPQQRLWFVEQLVPGTAQHNLSTQFRVRGQLDVSALGRAVNGVIARHEVLRTSFGVVAGAVVQLVADDATIAVRELVDADDAAILPKVAEFVRRPFDLAQAPLVRVGVGRDGDTHVLVFVVHHIVIDAWSMSIFLREVAELYRHERSGGGASPLPELPIQYVDYAIWQREQAETPAARERLAAQLRELAGIPTVLDLPGDRPRPAVQTFAGSSLSWRVEPPLARSIERLAREHAATPHMVLLATFMVVLSRWSRQSRLLVATPAANRVRVETEGLIGFFANTLVIPADLTGSPSFADHLERVRTACLMAVSRQDVPFESLVDGMAPERSLAHNPLVQVMLALQNAPDHPLELPGAGLEPIEIDTGTAQFDLVLNVTPWHGGLDCVLQYSTELFDRTTVRRFAGHLRRLWAAVVADPNLRVDEIDLADAPERATLVRWGTGNTRPVDRRAMPTRLLATARRGPDTVAVRAPDGGYSYAQLVGRAAAIGAELATRGLRPGDVVGVALPRGRDLPAGLLGVWLAGGAYLPLDPTYPRARLEYMARDAGVGAVLTTRALAAGIPVPDGAEVVLLDEPMCAYPGAPPVPETDAHAVAYVIYTSGSTGHPKGVVVEHASLGNLLDDFAAETGFDDRDRMLAITSLSFDIAGLELWLPLLTGATLVIAPAGTGGDPEQLHRLLIDEAITVVQATPATWQLYTSFTRAAPGTLRQVWSGGERLPHSLAQALTALGPEVHNLYGPTETTIWSTRAVLRARDTATGIGRPVANTDLYVVDAFGRPSPMCVPGELYIGGAGLARGYHGRPELTAQRFVTVHGVPAYRTGDLVRWRADGNLEYLGRLDDQVKIRGYRVEPGEIDAAARACPGVQDARTVVVTAASGEDQLVTFVTPGTSPRKATEDIAGGDPDRTATEDWRTVWENTYAEGGPAVADDLDLKGWRSSYTNRPLAEAEMRDWVERTVERIACTRARTFAEIGCGTGLLLLRLAPAADRYLGLDFSAKVIDQVTRAVVRRGIAEQVRLVRAGATEIGEAAAGELFDCVVLNSVAQYFPDRDHLTTVLVEASKIVTPGGHIFVGDLRSLALAEVFHASVLRADQRLRPAQLRALATRRALEEDELLVDPGYFTELRHVLPAVTGVQVSLKSSRFDNELTRFRYDVLLRIGGEPADQPRPATTLDWPEVGGIAGLERLLDGPNLATIVVDDIPNSRVARFVELIVDDTEQVTAPSLDEVEQVAAGHGWRAHHAWSRKHRARGRVRTTFVRDRTPDATPTWFHHEWPVVDGPVTNDPRQGALLRSLKHRTRAALRRSLPEYMVPNRILTLPELPLTPNGKTDQNALRDIAAAQASSTDHVRPVGPAQDLLHALWCEVLGVPRVGVTENVFDIGATSLLIVRFRQELRERHGLDIPLTAFFAHPTIASLADALEGDTTVAAPGRRGTNARTTHAAAERRRRRRRPEEKRQ